MDLGGARIRDARKLEQPLIRAAEIERAARAQERRVELVIPRRDDPTILQLRRIEEARLNERELMIRVPSYQRAERIGGGIRRIEACIDDLSAAERGNRIRQLHP